MTNKAGRPKFTPTPAQRALVSELTASGFPQNVVARRIVNEGTGISIDSKTLRRAFREELDHGVALANAEVANRLWRIATGNHPQTVTACIFWLKTRGGWKETFAQSDAESAPIDYQKIRDKLTGGLIPEVTSPATAGRRVEVMRADGELFCASSCTESAGTRQRFDNSTNYRVVRQLIPHIGTPAVRPPGDERMKNGGN